MKILYFMIFMQVNIRNQINIYHHTLYTICIQSIFSIKTRLFTNILIIYIEYILSFVIISMYDSLTLIIAAFNIPDTLYTLTR